MWTQSRLRPDQVAVLELLELGMPAGKVVDVGCFDGFLLRQLPDRYSRYGIEPSSAAERAAENGIAIIGSGFDSLLEHEGRFDAAVCVDVMEHVVEPSTLLRTLLRAVRPGGMVIVGTGNSDHPAFRLLRAYFWYVHFPEHISFVSPRWVEHQARILNASVERIVQVRHDELPATVFVKQLVQLGVRLPLAWVEQLVAAFSTRYRPRVRCPGPGLFRDNLVFALRRGSMSSTGDDARPL
jgi:2-polyprenyl-3-methyl-5-hydroxy-6-metoxy-1,4-benzoquinol methylase